MTFRHISELAGDVMRRVEIGRAATGCAGEAHSRRSAAVVGVATDAQGEGLTPVAYAHQGEVTRAQSEEGLPVYIAPHTGKRGRSPVYKTGGELNGKVATTEAAAELGGQEDTMKKPTRQTPRVMPAIGRASMSMVRDRPELPRSALIIDMSAWKRAHARSLSVAR